MKQKNKNMLGLIIDTIKLYRIYNNINLINKLQQPRAIKQCIIASKNMEHNTIRRKLTYLILTKLRKLNPYIIQDYSTAKLLYDNYFKLHNCITTYDDLILKVKAGDVYVTKFRNEIPTKGKYYSEYYINGSYSTSFKFKPIVYKLMKENIQDGWINMHDPLGYANVISICKNAFTNYKYSTAKEIDNFNFCENEAKSTKDTIQMKQDEITKLYTQLDKLKKSIY